MKDWKERLGELCVLNALILSCATTYTQMGAKWNHWISNHGNELDRLHVSRIPTLNVHIGYSWLISDATYATHNTWESALKMWLVDR